MSTWFGVPRWLAVAIVLSGALSVFLIVVVAAHKPTPPPKHDPAWTITPIVDGLRVKSVYAAPDARPVIDTARARQLIGDRPIVVALLDYSSAKLAGAGEDRNLLCERVADAMPTKVVMVFADDDDGYGSTTCTSPQFSKSIGRTDDFGHELAEIAAGAWTYRATSTDLMPEVEALVLGFDAQADEYLKAVSPVAGQPLPPRPSTSQRGQLMLVVVGLFAAVVAVFVLLRLFVRLHRHRAKTRAQQDERTSALSARLNRLADRVLRPGEPRDAQDAARQADIARRYVLALRRFEEDGPSEQARTQVGELEELCS